MIGIKIYDGYSGQVKVYLAETVTYDVGTRTLSIDEHEKIKLGPLDVVEFSEREVPHAH